jgi:MraZ protein
VLFTGHSEHTIDSKQRLAIPAKYRSQLDPKRDGNAWYSVPYPGGVIRVYTEARFHRLAENAPDSLTPGEEEAELDAALFGAAERLEMDSAGRVTIPRHHLALAGLTSPEVVIVGARNRLEIRDRGKWQAGEQERFARLPALVARVEARRARAAPGTTPA